MDYDVASVFEEIEMALIKSMRINMKRHIDEEYEEGINWTQWQAEMLAGLSQYRAENQDVLKGYMGRINAELDAAIRDAYATGESEQEIELLKAIKSGYKPQKNANGGNIEGTFFRTNQRKLNALVKATTDDMKKAETAMLRMQDDIYRKTLFKAQMFYNTGAGSMWKCVDMATKDFLSAGYNCVQYKNGARVNIASYSEMALRTANKRAGIMGQANFREKYGINLVKVTARGTACPMCTPYLGKVFVDDVWGSGTKEESKESGYPLLSSAVNNGLYHPNCKDSCSTFYEGINQPAKELTPEQEEEIKRRYNLEQEQRYLERNYKKNMRLGNGCLDQQDAQKYFGRASQYKNKLIDLCDKNSDVLRFDKQRLSLRGVLSVDNDGRLYIKPVVKNSANFGKIEHSDEYKLILRDIKSLGAEYREVKPLSRALTEKEIIDRIGGGDMTEGSCASLAYAYVGNKAGLDVLDFRDGGSRKAIAQKITGQRIANFKGVKSVTLKTHNEAKEVMEALKDIEIGKEYVLRTGQHAAIVRKTEKGVLQYLELQNGQKDGNGFKDFEKSTLKVRFGCKTKTEKVWRLSTITEVKSLGENEEFRDILGYINTASDKQKKGAGGFAK